MSKDRPLTLGEITLAGSLFRDSIDYDKVRIHNHGYIFFQPKSSGMAPNGEIYIKNGSAESLYQEDYSTSSLDPFFIHEMVHVWQKQNGVLNPIMSAIGNLILNLGNYGKSYKYELNPIQDLLDFRMEQQAKIIEDYYRLNSCPPLKPTSENRDLALVLEKFLANPSYPRSAR